ncbi:hypothetical protein C8Q77DRAFT_599567 [Trametes polyzona]|nr:hypothetical protein C8Q77DRAFT_599567 [Trametes polyzona]
MIVFALPTLFISCARVQALLELVLFPDRWKTRMSHARDRVTTRDDAARGIAVVAPPSSSSYWLGFPAHDPNVHVAHIPR